jgi:hypothetical protein
MKLRSVRDIAAIRWVLLVAAGLVIFFVGYQLALYQTTDNKELLPHFPVTKPIQAGSCYSSINHLPCYKQPCDIDCVTPDKPVIYLYPTRPEAVNVRIRYAAGFSQTIPSYNTNVGWNIIATPSGQLTSQTGGQTYPYLYWEGSPTLFKFNMNAGFVVTGLNTKQFLDTQLAIMGLTKNEAEDFMSYWLPKMDHNPYNLIHFAGSDYTNIVKLMITPKPESLLRVFMVFKPLTIPIMVTPQTFPTFHRVGFSAVEWGERNYLLIR